MTDFPGASHGRVAHLDDGVWLVRGMAEVRSILDDEETFRAARPAEFVSGWSRSFFLATDFGTDDEKAGYRAALAAALSPNRIRQLCAQTLEPLAGRLVDQLADPFDLVEGFVRPYGRMASYTLAGVPAELGSNLVARLRVAREVLEADPADPAGRALIGSVWREVAAHVAKGRLAPTSIPGHAMIRHGLSTDQAVLLTVPILEMAAYDMASSLTLATLESVARLPPAAVMPLREESAARGAVWEAARRLDDLYLTRIATGTATIDGQTVGSGTRLVLDLHAANSDPGWLADAAEYRPDRQVEHVTFGRGTHACMGRELAVALAVVALRGFLARGGYRLGDGNTMSWYGWPA